MTVLLVGIHSTGAVDDLLGVGLIGGAGEFTGKRDRFIDSAAIAFLLYC